MFDSPICLGHIHAESKDIAITTGLILFAGSFSGSAPIAFADHVEIGDLKDKAKKVKKPKKCKEEQKYNGICDKKKPKIKIESPKKKSKVGSSFTVTGTATDKETGVVNVMVRLDTTGYTTVIPEPDGSWEVTFTGVPDGKNKITAKATDKVGNEKRTKVKITVKS